MRIRLAALIIAVTAALLTYTTSRPVPTQPSLAEVCVSGSAGFVDVVNACTALIEAEGTTPETMHRLLFERAKAFHNNGQYQRARADEDRALLIKPDDVNTLVWRANTNDFLGDRPAADADFARAIKIDPENADVLRNKAKFHRVRSETDEALRAYERALQVDPNDAEVARTIVTLSFGSADFETGIRVLQQSHQRWPDEAWVHEHLLAYHLQKVGDMDAALNDVAEFYRVNQDPFTKHFLLALVHFHFGDDTAGAKHVEDAASQMVANLNEDKSLFGRAEWYLENRLLWGGAFEVFVRGNLYGWLREEELSNAEFQRFLDAGGRITRGTLLTVIARDGIDVSDGAWSGSADQVKLAVDRYIERLGNKYPIRHFQ